ncbi:MAG: hypothetical protein WCX73_03220 [Candidatus Pacearchaeota archaeon]|jgi:hypothetical protein
MRKITSKYKEEKRKKRNGIIVGIILIGIMISSTIGYSFLGGEKDNLKKINYNGFTFEEQNGFWITNINNLLFTFKYNPTQIEEINSSLNVLDNYYNKPLYIYSKNEEAELEIYRNLFYQNKIIQRMQSACLEGDICEGNLPIKSCEDNFIKITEGNISKIIQEENCVFIEGEKGNLTKLADEFLFNILEIR